MAMLNRDYHSRPTLQGIRTALKALVYEDYALDRDAVNMIKLSPSERGASVTTPTCLDREEEPLPAPQWNAVHPSGRVKYNPADFAPDRHQASTTLQRVFHYDDVREQVITTSQSPVHRPVLHYDHVYDEPVEGYHPADMNAPGFRPGRRPRQPYDPARYQALLESEAKTHELP
ncbi:cst-1 [Symbiodinium natans]|uniref:Cst-1 protein n=1 Tax=Symbiodinium natans TaxID=878477 RepID=A0A812U2S5_9DINO|nr:cst-1 [Symbiodinium natans]